MEYSLKFIINADDQLKADLKAYSVTFYPKDEFILEPKPDNQSVELAK
jgi:hypothetical protein